MEDQKMVVKEWQKDIKMSYTETYHRPHRDTWEDIDEMSKMGETLQTELQEEVKEPLFKDGNMAIVSAGMLSYPGIFLCMLFTM